MHTPCCRFLMFTGLVGSLSGAVSAQQVTVQQPVVQVFSVDTVVSVPDRGTAYLGGVSSAAEGRGPYGLFPSGSSTGLRRADTGVDAGVYIHDLQAMDDYLLSRSGKREQESWVNPNSRAAAAFDSLTNRRIAGTPSPNSGDLAAGRALPSADSNAAPLPDSGPGDAAPGAAFYLAHARQAEQPGQGSVAVLFYRMAARHGSRFANRKLQELSDE